MPRINKAQSTTYGNSTVKYTICEQKYTLILKTEGLRKKYYIYFVTDKTATCQERSIGKYWKAHLSNALDTITNAEIHDDPTDDVTPEHRHHDATDLTDARRHPQQTNAEFIKKVE